MTAAGSVTVDVRGLTVERGGVRALDGVSLAVPRGAVVAVIGPNGAGKSTLLAAIAGRLAPAAGTVEVRGSIADVPQTTVVDGEVRLPVLDVVRMGRYPSRGLLRPFRRVDHDLVGQALRAMDLTGLERRTIDTLSGGQRQRTLIAQGLAQQADNLLLDEPTAALDLPSQRLVLDAVRTEADHGRTVVFATHGMDEAAGADLVLVLASRVIAFGTPADVLPGVAVETLFAARPLRSGAPVAAAPT